MSDEHPLMGILSIIILIIIKAIISRSRIAFDYADEDEMEKKAEKGEVLAKAFQKMVANKRRIKHTFGLINLTISFVVAVVCFNYILNPVINMILLKERYYIMIFLTYIFSLFLLLYLVSFFGSILPGGINKAHTKAVDYKFIPIIYLFYLVFMPVTFIMEQTTIGICKLFALDLYDGEDNITEEEIISLVHEGKEQGVFMESEVEMISNVIELNEKEAQGIMTHKKRIVMINSKKTIDEAIQTMLEEGFSRYPLYEEHQDNILGILHLKDVIKHYLDNDNKDGISLKDISREAYFVPDTQNIGILFREMQSNSIHMAIAIDEYGQTAGLVAMEDILEEIVGNIWDEYDVEEKMVIHKGKNFYIVLGSISLEELEDELAIIIKNEDFDTLNGLLISLLDRIPQDGESATVDYQGYRFDILVTLNRMIEKVKISKLD